MFVPSVQTLLAVGFPVAALLEATAEHVDWWLRPSLRTWGSGSQLPQPRLKVPLRLCSLSNALRAVLLFVNTCTRMWPRAISFMVQPGISLLSVHALVRWSRLSFTLNEHLPACACLRRAAQLYPPISIEEARALEAPRSDLAWLCLSSVHRQPLLLSASLHISIRKVVHRRYVPTQATLDWVESYPGRRLAVFCFASLLRPENFARALPKPRM